jgi:hypothetical protein
VKGVRVVKPLNYIPYYKEAAMQELVDRFGWQRYPHKHYESRFTRFYEGYWLRKRFGFDKRRAHFSSLILTGQLSRDEALTRIAQDPYSAEQVKQDFEYIATKLGVGVDELQSMFDAPKKTYRDYANIMPIMDLGARLFRMLGLQRAVMR